MEKNGMIPEIILCLECSFQKTSNFFFFISEIIIQSLHFSLPFRSKVEPLSGVSLSVTWKLVLIFLSVGQFTKVKCYGMEIREQIDELAWILWEAGKQAFSRGIADIWLEGMMYDKAAWSPCLWLPSRWCYLIYGNIHLPES